MTDIVKVHNDVFDETFWFDILYILWRISAIVNASVFSLNAILGNLAFLLKIFKTFNFRSQIQRS